LIYSLFVLNQKNLVIAIIFFVGWALQGNPLLEMFNVGVSLAVAAIPEGKITKQREQRDL